MLAPFRKLLVVGPLLLLAAIGFAQTAPATATSVHIGTGTGPSLLPPKGGGGGGKSAGASPSVLPGKGQAVVPGKDQAKPGELTKEQKEQQAKAEAERKAQADALAKNKALNDAFNAGMEAKNAKNYPVAIENFEKAVAMSPGQHVVWAHLGESYMSLGDSKSGAEQQESFDKGIAAYAKAVEIKADDPNYHNNYGLALAKIQKMDQAQAELAKAAELDPPGAGKYFYNLGATYVNMKQNDAAEAAFKKATELDPNYADAYYQEALVLMEKATLDKDGKMQAPAGTAESLQKYLTLKPDGANAEAAKAILQALGSTVATSFQRPGEKQPAKSNQKKSK
jgi:tetratricopeptide (TPR) repeat protein